MPTPPNKTKVSDKSAVVGSFFDKHGRDRVIFDWLKINRPDFASMYESLLDRYDKYQKFNTLMLMIFEAGIEFGRAQIREARKE